MYKTKIKRTILQWFISYTDFTQHHLAAKNQTNIKFWVKKVSVLPLNLNFFLQTLHSWFTLATSYFKEGREKFQEVEATAAGNVGHKKIVSLVYSGAIIFIAK